MAHRGMATWQKSTLLWGGVTGAIIVAGLLVWESLGALPGMPRVRGMSGVEVLLLIGFLYLAARVSATLLGKPEISKAAGQILRIGGILAVLWWFIWGSGWTRVEELDRLRAPEARAAAPSFPLQYAGITPVSGSLAPRPTPATTVTAKGEGIWEVSIDGSNEYGYAEPAPGHRTKIMVRPGEKFSLRHLGGIPAINAHGDRVALCGTKRTVYKWEQRRFPDEPLYAVGVVTLGPTWPFRFTPWKCGRTDFELKNAGTEPFELVLWFNQNEVYRTPDGRGHSDGFAYSGWDGERVRFEVRRMPPGT